jgi:anaerobic selenocysteine-containing dehydrogenase
MPAAPHTCPLCEATCGLLVGIEHDGTLGEIRGDPADVFSAGFICPKGVALKSLHTDPDRLRTPMVRRAGQLRESSWGEAWAELSARLPLIADTHGRDAVAVFTGSGAIGSLGARLYSQALIRAIGTRNVYSTASLFLRPRQASAALLYGDPTSIPVPDVDRTSYLLLLGTNPVTSNGGLVTAPDLRSRLRALRRRGGRYVVVDPRRSSTADGADEHVRIRPGTDAALLLGMVHVLVAEGHVNLGRLAAFTVGLADVAALAADFTPERVARHTQVDVGAIRRMARDLAGAPAGVVHVGMGPLTTVHATVVSWLVDVLNVMTGNLDRVGGAMFPLPAHARPRAGQPAGRSTRVRGLPIICGEAPAAALSEEMDTAGDGRVRALLTIGGNPARSLPNSARFRAAVRDLDLLISVDTYLNETTALADVVLPVPSPLERSHYALDRYAPACRNTAKYSAPALPMPLGMYPEWETVTRLALAAIGRSVEEVDEFDDAVAEELAEQFGIDLTDLPVKRRGPERLLDILLCTGPYGLTLEDLECNPHGVDLGELEPRLPDLLTNPGQALNLGPAPLLAQAAQVRSQLEAPADEGLRLVGRRHLRSANSWLHNLPAMVSGARRCTLRVHPDDAFRLGLRDGGLATVSSARGEVVAAVEVTDDVLVGVVSLPHGWGHDEPEARLRVAAGRPGVNANLLTDDGLVDPLTGNAVFNGIPVTVSAHLGDAPAAEAPTPDRRAGLERRRAPRGPGGLGPDSFGPA